MISRPLLHLAMKSNLEAVYSAKQLQQWIKDFELQNAIFFSFFLLGLVDRSNCLLTFCSDLCLYILTHSSVGICPHVSLIKH